MQNNIRNTNLRFNLDKEQQRRAWEYLQTGKGYVAKRTTPNVTIRKISLAYYESNEPQEFLQPVYVFEGDNGFVAYVPAIKSEYLQ